LCVGEAQRDTGREEHGTVLECIIETDFPLSAKVVESESELEKRQTIVSKSSLETNGEAGRKEGRKKRACRSPVCVSFVVDQILVRTGERKGEGEHGDKNEKRERKA